jgi:FkbM family methyltransferase
MLRGKTHSRIFALARKMRPVLPYGILANLHQWLIRETHESDFEVFNTMPQTRGLVLDVGASRGQSALSVLRRARQMEVFSVEPNRKHRWSLLLIWILHPLRFRFRMVAAGDDFARKTLHVPGRRASGLSAQASLDPAEFEKDYVRNRLAKVGFNAADKTGYRRVAVRVVPLDCFSLSPDLIKLDVEGFEYQALKGLEKTLRLQRPALLIEINNIERWLPFLKSLGYAFYYYNRVTASFRVAGDHEGGLNLFCLHGENDAAVTRALLSKVER